MGAVYTGYKGAGSISIFSLGGRIKK